jgi:type I restriction enzyme S subunit
MEVRPGYKQTEVGVIPEDWGVSKLSDLGTVIRGASPRPKGDKRFYGGNIPRLMVEDVTRDGKVVIPQIDFLTEEGAKRSRPCKKGTLTIVCSGTVGIPSFLGMDACIHDGFLALVGIRKSASDDYLYHQLCRLQERFDSSATHGGVFTNLTTFGVKEFAIPLPPTKAEQEGIAEALSDADALVESLEQLIAKKRQVKQGAMQELLRPKDGWVEKKLGDIASFYKGKGLAKSELDPFGMEPCIHYGELFTRYPESIKRVHSRTCTKTGVFRSTANDVLMPTSDVTPNGLATASCILQDDVILGGDILVIRAPRNQLNGSFLSYMIRLLRDQIMQLVTGTTVYHLYSSDMKKFTFSMPRIEDQDAVVGTLDIMDAEIAALEEKLAKARRLKQGMMQELLTGRIRLV